MTKTSAVVDSDSESYDSWGSEVSESLIRDRDDKRRLKAMSQREREAELLRRSERRDMLGSHYVVEPASEIPELHPGGKINDSANEQHPSSVNVSSYDPELLIRYKEQIDIEDVAKIRLSRHKMLQFCHTPFFEDFVRGCFARIFIGKNDQEEPVYRLCEIVGLFESSDVYEFEDTRVEHKLVVKQGLSTNTFRLTCVSNRPFTDDEFEWWLKVLVMQNCPIPSKRYLREKGEKLEEYMSRTLTDEEQSFLIKRRNSLRAIPHNPIVARLEVMTEIERAKIANDTVKILKLEKRLRELNTLLMSPVHEEQVEKSCDVTMATGKRKHDSTRLSIKGAPKHDTIDPIAQKRKRTPDEDSDGDEFLFDKEYFLRKNSTNQDAKLKSVFEEKMVQIGKIDLDIDLGLLDEKSTHFVDINEKLERPSERKDRFCSKSNQ